MALRMPPSRNALWRSALINKHQLKRLTVLIWILTEIEKFVFEAFRHEHLVRKDIASKLRLGDGHRDKWRVGVCGWNGLPLCKQGMRHKHVRMCVICFKTFHICYLLFQHIKPCSCDALKPSKLYQTCEVVIYRKNLFSIDIVRIYLVSYLALTSMLNKSKITICNYFTIS